MGDFEIIKRTGERIPLFSREPFCTVKSATLTSALMGDDNVQLSIVSSKCITFGKGDKIVIGGNEYTIRTTVNRDEISEDYYKHDAVFYGVMYELMKTQYRDCDANGKSTRSTFDLTYSIKDFVKVIIYNLNRDYPGLWKFDEDNCPDTDPITIQFSKQNCLQVLQSLCGDSNFKLEFKISQAEGVRTIHIGKFGAKIVPPGGNAFFEWGKGNGLYNLKEEKVDDKSIKTRLWVEGGTTNIRADYRNYSERLQLPFPRRLNKNKHTLADGTVIEPESEMIGIHNDNDRFIEDGDLRDALGSDEDTAQYDNIYPRRTGEITALMEGDINSFVDDTMDFDLTEKDANGTKWLINDVAAKINFISGLLAGQQFELSAYDHSSKTFTLKPYTDNRGLTIPTVDTEAYRFRAGDKYTITEINLPKSYEDDAEEDLWYAGKEDFDNMKQARAQYKLTLDRQYLIDNTPDDADTSVFNVGDYVPIKDERFGIEKSIRIQKVVRNLLLEQDYSLTLSDTTAISIIAQTVVDVANHEQVIVNNRLRDLNKARRGWRTTEDLRNMVYDTDGFFDVDNIRPNSIDTNMLTVGSKSQQFVLTDVILQANVGGLPNRFDASAGLLSHLTINDDEIMHWNMGASEFTLGSPGGYYLFAKCSKKSSEGVWYLTQKQLRFEPEDDPNNYYFQVGILSPLREGDNFRDFTTTYGFTRINGNTITTGRIITSDGECYLDLDGNKFRIGDRSSSIDWNVSRNNTITLKNVSVISESGDVAPLGVYRGVWNVNYTYYKNDEVSYTDEKGAIATYRYIHNTPTKGHKPTESVYWEVAAKGIDGVNGAGNKLVYRYGYDKPAKPTGIDPNPTGWSDTPDNDTIKVTHGTAFTLKDGYYKSPAVAANGISTNRLTFTTSKPNQLLAIELWASSESGFDFVLVGKLDTEGLTRTANYFDRISGDEVKKVVYLPIPTAGTHFVDVAYAKDSSNERFNDCGRYRIVTPQNCWMSVGTIGSDGKIVSWSDPVPFSIDTPDVERIYRLMGSETTPATPGSDAYVDDYVPPLTTETHIVGKEYKRGDVVIGADGNYYECVVTTTTETPIAKSGQFWIISVDWSIRKGWSDNPTGVTNAYRYEYESVRKKKDGKWGAFSTPVLWMVLPLNGEKGDDGKNGDFTEYRYAVSGGKLSHGKAFTASDRNPGSDWTTVMPSVGSLQYLWLTTAKINGETNALRANWTTPIRVTPYDGVDGTPGKDGDVGPALVFRGIYSSSKSYVGSDKRVDVVKYNNHYYVARTDAGTFYNVLPTNTAKWNDFGAEFEAIATGFLFAENANIANLIFRNERLESQSQTNGVPNFFLDGLKNIASFGAGSAVFDGASAKLGWLNIVGRELLGFDDDGIQRLRLTPSSLPSVGGASSHEDVIIKATGGDATYTGTTNWEVSFEEDVWCYYGRDDHEDDMHDSLYAYIEFDIAEDNTLLDLSSIQFSCGVKRTNSTQYEWLDCSLSATAFLKVGTQWQTIGSVSLKDSSTAKITIPKKGRIKVSFNGTIDQTLYTDYSGKFTFATQAIWAITAKTEMIIAKDGFMAIYNANYLRMHSTDGLAVKIGNYHFRVTSSDISVSKNGTSWTKLIT